MKKKVLKIFLAIMMIFTITACGSKTGNKWEYSKEDRALFNEVYSFKALNQNESDIDIIYIYDIEVEDKISEEDVLVFNYDDLEEDENYEYVSYDLIKKYQINTEKIEIKNEPNSLLVYFYGDNDFFTNYGVLINKDVTKDGEYVITKTQKEHLGNDENYKYLTFAPLFSYLDDKGISMEKLIENGVITEPIAEKLANNDNVRLSNIGNLISYLGCDMEDIIKYDASGVEEIAHEINWNKETEKKQNYESTGFISFKPLLAYLKAHNITMYDLIKKEVITPTESTRIRADHNFYVSFVIDLCQYLHADVSDVIKFVEYQ